MHVNNSNMYSVKLICMYLYASQLYIYINYMHNTARYALIVTHVYWKKNKKTEVWGAYMGIDSKCVRPRIKLNQVKFIYIDAVI